jgi:glycine cleavage system H protein
MTVLLVLLTFVTFLLIDYFRTRNTVVVQPTVQVAKREARAAAASLVGGFAVPENLRYHPGHTWALSESPTMVRVGMDDFATKLAGKVESITLPKRGQWIRQGQKLCSLHRDGAAVDVISPIEGSVSDINDALITNPALARKDCYGDGWLVMVNSPDAKINFRNLIGGTLARWWTEESASRLQKQMPAFAAMAPAGVLAQDGGVAIEDVAAEIPDKDWAAITKGFFLS